MLKRLVRPIYHGLRALFARHAARQMVDAYAEHHRAAQEVYRRAGGMGAGIALAKVGVRVQLPSDPGPVSLPADWLARVRRVGAAAAAGFDRSEACLFLPKIERIGLPAATAEIPAVQKKQVIAANLRDPLTIDGLAALAEPLVRTVEDSIYGSYALIDKVYIYRNLVSAIDDQVSWRWHYDNHLDQIIKVMIYLTDVAEDTGPFEYLRGERDAARIAPLPHAADTWISPVRLADWIDRGYRPVKALGPVGTIVLFDDNCLHKANQAARSHRDVVVFQFRPADFKPERPIDPRWTGSFLAEDVNPDPAVYRVLPKTRTYSG